MTKYDRIFKTFVNMKQNLLKAEEQGYSQEFSKAETMSSYSNEIARLIDDACDILYSGGDEEDIIPILQKAKQLHIQNGGDGKNWPGLTDSRGIWDVFSYDSI